MIAKKHFRRIINISYIIYGSIIIIMLYIILYFFNAHVVGNLILLHRETVPEIHLGAIDKSFVSAHFHTRMSRYR